MKTSFRSVVFRAGAVWSLAALLPAATSCRQVLGIEERKLRVDAPDGGDSPASKP